MQALFFKKIELRFALILAKKAAERTGSGGLPADLRLAFSPGKDYNVFVKQEQDVRGSIYCIGGLMAVRFEGAAIEFAMNLFSKSVSEEENVLVSPLSVSLCLGMLLGGAEGETKEAMRKALAGDLSDEEFRNALTEYAKSLPSDEKTKFHFADSIWIEKAFKLNRKFEKQTEKQFKSVVERLPFDERAVRKINDWVSKETDGMIDSESGNGMPNAVLLSMKASSPISHSA